MSFDPEKYWSQFDYKKWVVTIVTRVRVGRRRKEKSEVHYAGARTREGAIQAIKYWLGIPKNAQVYVRLATPQDLGATELPEDASNRLQKRIPVGVRQCRRNPAAAADDHNNDRASLPGGPGLSGVPICN